MAFFDDLKEVIHEAKDLFPDGNAGNGNMDDSDTKAVFLKCPYCGAQNKIIWREGALPRCPSCGGEYDSSQVEEQKKAVAEAAEKRERLPKLPLFPKGTLFLSRMFPGIRNSVFISFLFPRC